MREKWKVDRIYRSGEVRTFISTSPNRDMAKTEAMRDAKRLLQVDHVSAEWEETESDPLTLVWEIDSNHSYRLTRIAAELG